MSEKHCQRTDRRTFVQSLGVGASMLSLSGCVGLAREAGLNAHYEPETYTVLETELEKQQKKVGLRARLAHEGPTVRDAVAIIEFYTDGNGVKTAESDIDVPDKPALDPKRRVVWEDTFWFECQRETVERINGADLSVDVEAVEGDTE